MISRQPINRLASASRFSFVLLLLLAIAGTANGHGDGGVNQDRPADSKVRAVLDALPPELDGIHVELRRTLAPQLLVANPTDQTLSVDAENGRTFLRIGPGQVQGDLGAAAFHRTNTLMAPGTFDADASEAPRWQVVEKKPNWGWFDLRLRTETVSVPHAVVDAGETASVGQWSIPVQLGDNKSTISGHFEYEPPPRGIGEAQIADTGKLSDTTVVRALTGSKLPGMFISYHGDKPLTVLGANDEPFLRFGTDGVQVNRHSATWKESTPPGAPSHVQAEEEAPPMWARVSAGNAYGWIDPRAAYDGAIKKPDEPHVIKRWQIPVLIGDERTHIKGVTEWQPITPRRQAKAAK